MKRKTKSTKKRNKQDATLININALKKRVKELERIAASHERAIIMLAEMATKEP